MACSAPPTRSRSWPPTRVTRLRPVPSRPVSCTAAALQLKVTDPRNAHVAYTYLFRRSGTGLDPSAGRRYVQYDFVLTSGAYKTTYELDAGPNPGVVEGDDELLHAHLPRPVAGRRPDDQRGRGERSRHSRPPQGAARSRELRKERRHLRRRRGSVHREHRRTGSCHPQLRRRQQRAVHGAYADLLRTARGRHHRPARALGPGTSRLLRLQRRGRVDAVFERPQPHAGDDRREPGHRAGRRAVVGEGRRAARRAHPRVDAGDRRVTRPEHQSCTTRTTP